MREFFKGWRRKVGLLTLLLACLVVAGWVRSFSNIDSFILPSTGHRLTMLSSSNGVLQWFREPWPVDQVIPPAGFQTFPKAEIPVFSMVSSSPTFIEPKTIDVGELMSLSAEDLVESQILLGSVDTNVGDEFGLGNRVKPNLKAFAFEIYEEASEDDGGSGVRGICVPNWSTVIPLTLISAWLVISKPRPSKSKTPVQFIPETVA